MRRRVGNQLLSVLIGAKLKASRFGHDHDTALVEGECSPRPV
jgi:hypothetical protein